MAECNVTAMPCKGDKHIIARAQTTASREDEARWRLVLSHAPTATFLYGVVSTGIFCRTSCPSRRPRRANVRFFESASSATAAGFRACRRCRPESTDASDESPRAAAEKQVRVACEYVRERKGDVQLSDLASHVGLSPRYFHGLFKQVVGQTPGAYAAAVRREHEVCLQRDAQLPVVLLSETKDSSATDGVHLSFTQSRSLEWAGFIDLDSATLSASDSQSFGFWSPDQPSNYIDPSVLGIIE